MLTRDDLAADQLNAIQFIDSGEDTLLCADVGTGKTVIALTAGQNAIYAGEVKRWLVLAPLMVATDTWALEASEWRHLQDMDVRIACGSEDERIEAIRSTAQFVVLNYENLSWLMERYPRVRDVDMLPFDGLICDEIDKLKDVSSSRFKDFRNRIKKFNKRIGMTGTLVPNDLTEVWGQTYMVDGGQTFGRSFYKWRKENFYPTDYKQYNWAPFPATRDKMIDALDGLAYRLPAEGLPPVVAAEPHKMALPAATQALYDELEREFYLIVEDGEGKHREVDAPNQAVLQGKLQQICSGFSYVDKTKEAVWHSYDRFDWLERLHKQLGRQLLVFYHFNAELDELKRRYLGLPYLGAGVSTKKKRQHIADWNAGSINMLALHPASAGHGLNLQKSGACDIAFLTIPWSGGLFEQVCGRLARRGQTAEQVNTHTALFTDTVDEQVFSAVVEKRADMKDFLGGLHTQQTDHREQNDE